MELARVGQYMMIRIYVGRHLQHGGTRLGDFNIMSFQYTYSQTCA